MKWLAYIFSLFPVCDGINAVEIWLTGLVLETSNTLDDAAVAIIIGMLRTAFGCEKDYGTGN